MIHATLPTDTTLSQIQPDDPRTNRSSDRRLCSGDQFSTAAFCADAPRSFRHIRASLLTLIFTSLLVSAGCRQESGPRQHSDEEARAQREELLKKFPPPPPDTPEQIQQKEATVAESLPKVHDLLEQTKTDPTKADEAVELSTSLVALVPSHREAIVAYCKAQLASFFAKEVMNAEGRMLDEHHMAIAIRSAAAEIDRLRKDFVDLSEDEVLLCHEIYFHRARLEGFYPLGSEAPEIFRDTVEKLVSSGFRDVERLRKEPRFQHFFTNPKFAPVLQAAIAKMEGAAKDVPAADTAVDEQSQEPE